MREVLPILLMACLAAGTALATARTETTAAGTTDETLVINVFQWGPRDVDPADEVVAHINDALNIDLRINRILAREYTQNLEIKIAAGDIPDLFRIPNAAQYIYVNLHRDGFLANQSDYAERYDLADLQAWFALPEIADFSEEDGFYRSPTRRNPVGSVGIVIARADWMDDLGLDSPTTYDEFKAMLQAVARAEPGGEDTVPITGNSIARLIELTRGFHGATAWKQQNGQWVSERVLPGYRDALRYLRDLYAEGLIDREYFTLNETQSRGKWVSGSAFIAIANGSTFDRFPQYTRLLTANDPTAETTLIDPLPRGPAGIVYGGTYGLDAPWVVPKRDKSEALIARAVSLLDYVHSEQGNDVVLNGVEGVHYVMQDGERVTNEAHERDIIPGLGHMFAMSTDYAAYKMRVNDIVDRSREIGTEHAVHTPISTAYTGEAYLENMPLIQDVHDTWFTDFVTGAKDLEREWDAYLAALDRVGLAEVTAEINATLDS